MSVTALPAVVVRVETDRLFSDGFIATDRHTIDAISAALDPEACAHDLLHLGAHLAGLAAGTGSLAELEARVGVPSTRWLGPLRRA